MEHASFLSSGEGGGASMAIRTEILSGHVIDVLKKLPNQSVHMVVTSPPYW